MILLAFWDSPTSKRLSLPHLKRIYQTFNPRVRFFHNDAAGIITAGHLKEIGINLFNFSFNHPIDEIRRLAGDSVTLLGNLPPRDVLALGKPAEIQAGVKSMMGSVADHTRIIWSCGGGMPPDVSTENLRTFITAVRENS